MNQSVAKIMSKLILAEQTIHIKLLGDSITHGVGGTGFEQNGEPIVAEFARNPDGYCWARKFKEHMEAQYHCTVTNNACTGTDIQFILKHFEQLVDEGDDIIICTIGTNNRHQFFKDGPKRTKQEHMAIFYQNLIQLHNKLKEAGKEVIFIANIPASPQNEQDGEDYWRLLHMNDIHDLYLKASAECNFAFISLYSLFNQYCRDHQISVDSLLDDGLHPNDKGYDVMYELLMLALSLG